MRGKTVHQEQIRLHPSRRGSIHGRIPLAGILIAFMMSPTVPPVAAQTFETVTFYVTDQGTVAPAGWSCTTHVQGGVSLSDPVREVEDHGTATQRAFAICVRAEPAFQSECVNPRVDGAVSPALDLEVGAKCLSSMEDDPGEIQWDAECSIHPLPLFPAAPCPATTDHVAEMDPLQAPEIYCEVLHPHVSLGWSGSCAFTFLRPSFAPLVRTADPSTQQVAAGATATFELGVTNMGDTKDRITLRAFESDSDLVEYEPDWPVEFSPKTVKLAPGSSSTARVDVYVPTGAAPGLYRLGVVAGSKSDPDRAPDSSPRTGQGPAAYDDFYVEVVG